MKKIIGLALSAWLALPTFALAQTTEQHLGVLIMAHGGIEDWEKGVLDTVAPLQQDYAMEVAFGMADAVSIQEAVTRLEARGVNQIAVVRLFISGESWYERTAQILGMQEGAPAREPMAQHGHGAHGQDENAQAMAMMGHSMEFWKVDSQARFALSKPGLAEAPQIAEVLLTRASELSQNPEQEDVLILAHGPEDDAENARWLAQIDERANNIRTHMNFRHVQVATLREDWEDKRVEAEAFVRAYVENANNTGAKALVIPYRVHGFGPYAQVLEGLEYTANERGLIPHPGVTAWIIEQIAVLKAELQEQ